MTFEWLLSSISGRFWGLLPPVRVLGQAAVEFTEWSWPETAWEGGLLALVTVIVIGWCVEFYRRDSRSLSTGWRILLPLLRITAILILLIVFFNPRTRTQTWAQRPSRVAILVDVSSSMQNPAFDRDQSTGEDTNAAATVIPTRAEQVRELLASQPWLTDLRRQHEVSLFTFDRTVSSRLATFSRLEAANGAGDSAAGSGDPMESITWEEILQPTGGETRLGEAVTQLMREINGRTLAGIVVLTDGGNNAGTDTQAANDVARQLNVRLLALGTGGLKPPVNIEVAKIVAPSDVQLGDPYDIEAYVRGEGAVGEQLTVELLALDPGGASPQVLAEQEVTLLEDRTPVRVVFPRTPTVEGEAEYTVRVRGRTSLQEVKADDNERTIAVNAFERPVKVLVFAGGPSWDYRFLCGMLKRHPGFTVDGLLQTGGVGMSQDVDNILLNFPPDKAALYEYDVIVAFDPDWSVVSEESRRLFEKWVGEEGGGAIFVAGDIFTPLLAASRDTLPEILYLYPVFLDTILPGIDMVAASTQVRPFQLTPEGIAGPILQVTEDPVTSEQFWKDFPGFYRFYPTSGPKSGATVYATAGGAGDFAETEPPILLASQFYGQGRTFYLGAPEFYRLRAEEPEYFERFWSRLHREAALNRLRRSNPRGTLLVDQDVVRLGDSIKVRARLLDAEFEPLTDDQIAIEVEQPDGRLLNPGIALRPDPAQAGRFQGEVRASLPGRYQVRLRIPGTNEIVRESIVAEVPDLENQNLRQDIRQLQTLTAETGGGYFPLTQAADVIARLPDSSEQFLLGEQIRTLWDRGWLMCLAIGLFGCEWLIRKLLRLA